MPSSLHLKVNDYNAIYITFGTYSAPIVIKSSDNSPFVTNMQINFKSLFTSMKFIDNPTYLYLGSSSATFQIGIEQNVIPTSYTFDIVKKETSISATYSTLSSYPLMVRSIPVSVAFPTSFTVPIGGCSMPVSIVLSNLPYSNLIIYFQYDTTVILPDMFWIKQ